jgi:hypothetical protein
MGYYGIDCRRTGGAYDSGYHIVAGNPMAFQYSSCSNFHMQMYASTHVHRISLLLLQSQLPQDPRAFLVLHKVHSRVYVIARANIGDGLINQPDQAKGFAQDVQRRIVVPILRNLMIGTMQILAEKDAIRQFHVFPLPAARVARLAGRKEAPHLDNLPTTPLDFVGEQIQQFA